MVSVGHFSIDTIFLPHKDKPFVILGGSVTYASLAARRLDAQVAVFSKVGGDFPSAYSWWLRQEGVDLSGVFKVESAQTTRFELKYSSDLLHRTLKLKSRAPSIAIEDLPSSLKTQVVHIAPIANEISYEGVEKLRKCAKVLSLDPQGLVRNFDKDGNVTLTSPADVRILELVNIYKSSLSEINAITNLSDLKSAIKAIHDHGVETVIVTLGIEGAVLSMEGAIHKIPACKSERVVDPTGAGDAFIGGFLAEYVHSEDLLWCGCVGSATASFVVEAVGPTFFGGKEEIYRRARAIYGKEIKV